MLLLTDIKKIILSWKEDNELSFGYTEFKVVPAHPVEVGYSEVHVEAQGWRENYQHLAVEQNPVSKIHRWCRKRKYRKDQWKNPMRKQVLRNIGGEEAHETKRERSGW